ncbi:MAG: hypothetical protein HYS12_02885 [Planctomycetes bacterium]|nr:hypothetical protein [Planctomycetota bacterium]
MSRKKRRQENTAATPVPGPAPAAGPELLRRYLLGLLTALIVARPFVLGEDPGILAPLTDTSNLVLTLLWMVAAVGWAAWRAWSRRGAWYGGFVEAGLLAAVVLVFVGAASVARYKHPAQLIAWEWLVLFLALFLMRQLAVTDQDRRGLLSAFLATAVILSAYALYQSAVELPAKRDQLRAELERPADQQHLALLAVGPAGVLLREQRRADREAEDLVRADEVARRLEINERSTSTFADARSFAGYLVLLLPALAVAAWLCWRRQGAGPASLLTAGCVLLVGAALWTTHALGATANLRDTWSATRAMIDDHPWLGVGAGNFGRLFPQYAGDTAAEDVAEPHNFVLELWASYGVFALAAVLLALGAFFYLVLTRRPAAGEGEAPAGPRAQGSAGASPSPVGPTRWEFYIGGMAGLSFGYFLREASRSADELLLPLAAPSAQEVNLRALVAGGRSVLWFAAFALFEGVPWTRRAMASALAVGVAALLLHLAVAGSISFPSVAQPLWLCVGLALGALHLPPRRVGADGLPGRAFPLPVAAGVAMGYFAYVFLPVSSSASLAWKAFSYARVYREQAAKGFPEISNPPLFLWDRVLKPLGKAVDEDQEDAHRWCQLAHWFGEMWMLPARDRHPRSYIKPEGRQRYAREAIRAALQAQKRDPDGREGYFMLVSLHWDVFARDMRTAPSSRKEYGQAIESLQELVRLDPAAARTHFSLAKMLFATGQAAKGHQEALEAQRLDRLAARPQRRLSPEQRRQIEAWLKQPVSRR